MSAVIHRITACGAVPVQWLKSIARASGYLHHVVHCSVQSALQMVASGGSPSGAAKVKASRVPGYLRAILILRVQFAMLTAELHFVGVRYGEAGRYFWWRWREVSGENCETDLECGM
jgi:hypothetical protein